MKLAVVVIAVANAVVLGLLVDAYLWVFDINVGGVTHWQNPIRVAVLTMLASGATA
jgi:hypothetical protein